MNIHVKAARAARPRATINPTRMQLLRDAWLAHILKRAIVEVGQAADEDYRAFGMDRDDLLAKLNVLLDETRSSNRIGPVPLSIAVARVRSWTAGTAHQFVALRRLLAS